jgi:hypothetical protein
VHIQVPLSAAPGLHLAAVLFQVAPEGGSEGIRVTAATAAALEVAVSGAGDHDVSLVAFGPSERLYARGPVPVAAVFANRGTTVVDLAGTLQIVSFLKSVKGSVDISPAGGQGRLYPGSERQFDLQGDVGPGLYRAVLDVTDGVDSYRETVFFAVIPWPLGVILLVAAVIALVMARIGIDALLRRRNR